MNNIITYTNKLINIFTNDLQFKKTLPIPEFNYKRDLTKKEFTEFIIFNDETDIKIGDIISILFFGQLIYGIIEDITIDESNISKTLKCTFGNDTLIRDIYVPDNSFIPTDSQYEILPNDNFITSFDTTINIVGSDGYLNRDVALRQQMRQSHLVELYDVIDSKVIVTTEINSNIIKIQENDLNIIDLSSKFATDTYNSIIVYNPLDNGEYKIFYNNSDIYKIWKTEKVSTGQTTDGTVDNTKYEEFSQEDADNIFKTQDYNNEIKFKMNINHNIFKNDSEWYSILGKRIEWYSIKFGIINTFISRVEFNDLYVMITLGVSRSKFTEQQGSDLIK